jgi:hypothetical protein
MFPGFVGLVIFIFMSCSVPIFCLVFFILPNGWLLLCVSNVPGCDVSGESLTNLN